MLAPLKFSWTRSLRPVAAAATAALSLALLAGCGDSGEAADSGAEPSASTAAYPVTITHKLGTAKVEKAPTRIITLSDVDLDSLLVLGLQPVGISASIGDDGLTPWSRPKLTGKPTVLEAGDNGFSTEDVLALDPDLILAGGDYYISDEYKDLSAAGIPVTAFEQGPSEDSWQTTLRQVAKAVGRGPQAEQVITDVTAQVAKVKTDNPTLVGKSFSLSQMWEAGSIGVLRSKDDAGVKMLNDFGLTLDPKVAALKGDDFAVQISLEKVGLLDSNVALTYFADPKLQPSLEGNALFSKLPVVSRGAFVPLTVEQFSSLRGPTPLSVPYVISGVVPLLVKAVDAGK